MLVVEQVHFTYNDGPVLDGLDLDVGDGEMVGIAGPNGSGKTTLLRLVSGLLRSTGGRILIDGVDVAALRASDRAKLVSVVPQDPRFPVGFSVVDLVLMGRNPHLKLLQWEGPCDLAIATLAMEATGIDHLADRRIETISGGERQRTVIAMALAQEAPLFLLDEPTASLDLAHQAGVMDMLRNLHKVRGGAILVAMHDLTLAAQYCNRLILLSDGRNYAQGQPEDVLTRENISKVYGVDVYVLPHPQGGGPIVVPALGHNGT